MEKHSSHQASLTLLHLFTDASDLGYGFTFDKEWFFWQLSSNWLQFHIAVREFLPIVIAFGVIDSRTALWFYTQTISL